MCYSSSIQSNVQQDRGVSDEQQIRDVMTDILNRIEKEQSNDSTRVLFRASSVLQRQKTQSLVEHSSTLNDHDDVFHDHPLTKSSGSDPPLHEFPHVLSLLSESDINQMTRSFDRVPSRKSIGRERHAHPSLPQRFHMSLIGHAFDEQ